MHSPHGKRGAGTLIHHASKIKSKTPTSVATALTDILRQHGYTVSVEKQTQATKKWSDFKIAIPIALAFGVGFVLLQKAGLVNLVSTGTVSYGTAFVVGIIASLSELLLMG